jgi:pyruvate dehydrogenase E2 component (dihydrolipoamide acetyltransferase)
VIAMTARIQAITMPKWGMTMTEGMLVAWLAREGDRIVAGQEIMEVETEKITNVVESQSAGLIRRLVVQEGMTAPVGGLLAVLAENDAPEDELEAFIRGYARPIASENAKRAAPTARLISSGQYALNVLSVGEGPATPVVLIHGFGGDSSAWLFNQEALSVARSVHAVNLPGHGGSAPAGSSGLDDMVAAVIATMTALNVDKAHLVGHSLGGAVALAIAASARDRIPSLSLLAPVGLGSEISAAYVDGFLAADRRKPMRDALACLFANGERVSPEMVENALRSKRLDETCTALGSVAATLVDHGRQAIDLRRLLSSIAVPSLVIWGEKDAIVPIRHADGLPASVKIERLADVGHMPMMEAASAVNRALSAHFETAEP